MDALSHVKAFTVSPGRLALIAAAMAAYLLLVIWPSFIWLRQCLAVDASPAAPDSLLAVLLCAALIAVYAFVVMKSLCLPRQ